MKICQFVYIVWENKRIFSIFLIHVFIASLTVNCGESDYVGKGPYTLEVTAPEFEQVGREIELFVDERIVEGEITGFVTGQDCEVIVKICYDNDCDKIFKEFISRSSEDMFEIDSGDSDVFSAYLDDFDLCYRGDEFWSEPMSGQLCDCKYSHNDFEIILKSSCESFLEVAVDIKYFDDKAPFVGICDEL
jgi:hypothetical protein